MKADGFFLPLQSSIQLTKFLSDTRSTPWDHFLWLLPHFPPLSHSLLLFLPLLLLLVTSCGLHNQRKAKEKKLRELIACTSNKWDRSLRSMLNAQLPNSTASSFPFLLRFCFYYILNEMWCSVFTCVCLCESVADDTTFSWVWLLWYILVSWLFQMNVLSSSLTCRVSCARTARTARHKTRQDIINFSSIIRGEFFYEIFFRAVSVLDLRFSLFFDHFCNEFMHWINAFSTVMRRIDDGSSVHCCTYIECKVQCVVCTL